MTEVAVFALALAGFCALCLSRPRHQRELLARPLDAARSRRLLWAGYAGLAASLAVALARCGFAYGVMLWLGLLSLSAATVVATLTARRP